MKINAPCGRVEIELREGKIRQIALVSRPSGKAVVSPKESPLEKSLRRDLMRYFAGDKVSFLAYPITLSGLPEFTRKVLATARRIPHGARLSYGEVAAKIGSPKAARAVGQALGRNPLPIIIPCHRVVGKQGDLTGFSAGLNWKKALLALENRGTRKP
jgi:methylated-DNA-[protein]-cysteine S-methyltransferase